MNPPLTVGLPVYNGAEFLAETIDSIVDQSFGDFELIVADNASTDGSLDIAHQAAATDRRVRVLPATVNRGSAWNWNRTVHEATGDMFRWACHDDLLRPRNLEVCVHTMRGAPAEVVLVYPRTELIDERGRLIGSYHDVCDLRQRRPHERFQVVVRDLHLINPIFGVHRTEALRSTRLMGGFGRADTVLMGEIALRGQVWEVPERLFRRRIHSAMSMELHGSGEDLDAFYDTANTGSSLRLPFARVLRGHLAAIAAAPVSTVERLRCVWTLGRWRYRRRLLRETARAVAEAGRRVTAKAA